MAGPYTYDRVKETSTTTGTGTLTLAGAVSEFQSFAIFGDGNSCDYCVQGGAEWEMTRGTYTAAGTTLTRASFPYASTNSSTASITGTTGSGVPIVITSAAHGLSVDQWVVITGVGGNTAANGYKKITAADTNTFTIDGPVGNGTYTSGGSWKAYAKVSLSAGTKNVFVSPPAAWFNSPLTPGSVVFANALGLLSQDNAGLFYDTVNDFLGLGQPIPVQRLNIGKGHIRFDHEAVPGACAAALAGAGAGNVDNGTHAWKVTLITAAGETTAGTGVTLTVVDKTVNGQVSLTAIPTGTVGVVTSRNIYRTKAGGGPFYLLATIADNTTTIYTDNTADSSLPTTTPPAFSSTAAAIVGGNVQVGTAGGGTFTAMVQDRGGTVRSVKAYGAVGGTTVKTDGSMTAASAVLTSSGFAAADVGKLCSVAWAGANQIANPTVTATVVANGGGSTGGILAPGDYRIKYTFATKYGETTGGTSESAVFTVVYGNIPRATLPSLPANANGINIYLTPVGGTTNTEVQYLFGITATTADLALTERSDGAVVPSVNRTAGPLNSIIIGFTNSTTVTLADAATTTVSSAHVLFGWDDTDTFQAAIDAGTGIVFVPAGSYMVSQLRMKFGVWLRGAGQSTQVNQRAGTNGHLIIADDNTVLRLGVFDIDLHGRKLHQTTVNNGIHLSQSGLAGDGGHTISRVRIEYCAGDGLYMGADVRGCLIIGNYYLYNDGINQNLDATSTDCLYVGNVGGQSGKQGCKIAGNNNNFLSNKMFWSGQVTSALGYAFHVTANNNEITGCTGQDSQSHDLYLDGALRTAVGNFIFDNSRTDAVRLNACFDCTVRGTSLSFVRNQRTSIVNILGSALRNIVAISFDAGAVATGNQYVQGSPTGNDVSQVGPTGGYQIPTFPTTRTWTVVAATDVITASSAHSLNDGEPVFVTNSGGALPASTPQIATDTLYYARDLTATTFKLAATRGGAAIDFTGTGTGTHTVQLPLQPNPYNGTIYALTQTGDIAIALPQKFHQGQELTFQLTQDATGGRNIGFSTGFTIQEFLPRTSANSVNLVTFINDGTNWIQTAGQFSAVANVRLAGDYTITTTQADVADAVGNTLRFAIGSREVWSFEFNLQTGSSSSAGIQFALTTPAGATLRAVMEGMTTAVTAMTCSIMTVSGTLAIAVNTVALNTGWVKISGTIANGTADGFLTLQADKVTSGTGTVFTNSYLAARRIA